MCQQGISKGAQFQDRHSGGTIAKQTDHSRLSVTINHSNFRIELVENLTDLFTKLIYCRTIALS